MASADIDRVPAASATDPSAAKVSATEPSATRASPRLVFVAAASLSAFLLFGVQPMFAKMVLPALGGAPGVWSVAMVFFQTLLLAGYAYAHVITRLLPLRTAALVHLLVLGAGFAALPIAIASGWGRPPASGEALWLLGLFFVSVGLPFFAVSANGPLLQAWFAASGRKGASDPYFLYAASNLGSFGALVAYPLAIEPFVTLGAQSSLWTFGFVGLVALIAASALLARGDGENAARETSPPAVARKGDRAPWICLAFVPSALLVAVTAHISTDVAAMPLLWVVPLALFLLTFVLAFRTNPLISAEALARAQVWLTAIALVSFITGWPIWFSLPLHLVLFFTIAMSAHTALFKRRPAPSDLTRFYLFMSLGGVLGGVFCALLAPWLFSSVLEYPILLVAALFCLPAASLSFERLRGFIPALVTAAALVAVCAVMVTAFDAPAAAVRFFLAIGLAAAMAALWRRPEQAIPFAAAAAVVVVFLFAPAGRGETVRSFFGVHKLIKTGDGRFLTLMHGNTIHGAVRVANDDGSPYAGPAEPTTYFGYDGALGRAVAAIRAARGGALPPTTVIGLGAGSLACHAKAGEDWRFLEIDDAVVKIARDSGRFPFLRDCAPNAGIVLGDARLTLADQPGGMGLIVVDAFSSDAIPTHLMTRNALALYLSKLDARGSLLFNITNRHLDLAQILARAGADLGLKAYVRRETQDEPVELRMHARATAFILTRDARDIGAIADDPRWIAVAPDMARQAWTDDFSNVVEAIRDRQRL